MPPKQTRAEAAEYRASKEKKNPKKKRKREAKELQASQEKEKGGGKGNRRERGDPKAAAKEDRPPPLALFQLPTLEELESKAKKAKK